MKLDHEAAEWKGTREIGEEHKWPFRESQFSLLTPNPLIKSEVGGPE